MLQSCLAARSTTAVRHAGVRAGSPPGLTPLVRRKRVLPSRLNGIGLDHLEHGTADAAAGALRELGSAVSALYMLAEEPAAQAAAAASSSGSSSDGGAFGFLADGFEAFLQLLEGGLDRLHVPYAYGFAIILLTIMVKLATFPLSRKSMESTMAMQAMQPRVKELQARYANDPETLQIETARLYRDAGVNPLAGCLPTLATIPVFIGLYRALTKAADEGLLTQGFFWIPSLGGPTSMAMRQAGSGLSWLFPLQDGAPPIGWHDAAAYLVLPVLLVISQFVSQKIISPQNQDPSQQQAQNVLRFIPFMIGWFSLNVPSGLTLYWLVNNIISTAQQIYMKKTIKVNIPAATPAAGMPGTIIDVSSAPIRPKEERVKKLSGKEMGSRKRRDDDDTPVTVSAEPAAPPPQQQSGGKGAKFRARKAREAAAKAASKAAPANGSTAPAVQAEVAPVGTATATSELDRLKVPDAPPSKE